jgi:DNA-binding NtrC family response regulator
MEQEQHVFLRLPTCSMNILLIDDDRITLKVIRKLLSDSGHQVFPACNKLNALKKIMSEKIDCVVSDVQMPDTSIGELFTELRSAVSSKLPIILISTELSNPEIDETLIKGADAFIPKPINMELLNDVINRLCKKQ